MGRLRNTRKGGIDTMNDIQAKAEKLFANCFAAEELEFLHHHPRFIEATHKIESIVGAFDAVGARQDTSH